MNQNPTSRARELQVRLYNRIGHGFVATVADACGYSREYVSRVLNERVPPGEALDKIEAWLDELDTEKAA